jgi:maltooligosyltrehalose trehalohydrolase
MSVEWRPSLGAYPLGQGTRFRLWAPKSRSVEILVERNGTALLTRELARSPDGTFASFVEGVRAGDCYRFRMDGQGPFPDPASRYQPEGVHGPSEVVDPCLFPWADERWRGLEPESLVIYELHVGTFSPEGTFSGVADRLEYLRNLGVTAIELMPVADFAGGRSWGYDGVAMFAPARCYGTPDDLRRLVDRAHRMGIGVILDVVYNHFGPVGNYAYVFSNQYLSQRESDWAACVNLDGRGSERVREFFIENALLWLHEYHIDGLRLDATHALHDEGSPHFLDELAGRVHSEFPGRWVPLIAEDHRNLDTMIRPRWAGGWDLDAVWADDFHHQMRRFLSGDHEGYFRDYQGTTDDIATTINQGWFYTGQHSVHMDHPRGTDPVGIEPRRFVVCLQNHDQVGNRAFGDRLHHVIDLPAFRAATALFLMLPQTPLLFMGQEWGASAPFQYFTDHDEDLGKIVTEGRRREFRHFLAFVDPAAREKIPDPQAVETFQASRLDWTETHREPHASLLRLHRALLALRRAEPALQANLVGRQEAVSLDDSTLLLDRRDGGSRLLVLVCLRGSGTIHLHGREGVSLPESMGWQLTLTTEDEAFTTDAMAPEVDLGGLRPVVRFARPGAVLLKSTSEGGSPR